MGDGSGSGDAREKGIPCVADDEGVISILVVVLAAGMEP
jgi:hypothetical protein